MIHCICCKWREAHLRCLEVHLCAWKFTFTAWKFTFAAWKITFAVRKITFTTWKITFAAWKRRLVGAQSGGLHGLLYGLPRRPEEHEVDREHWLGVGRQLQ